MVVQTMQQQGSFFCFIFVCLAVCHGSVLATERLCPAEEMYGKSCHIKTDPLQAEAEVGEALLQYSLQGDRRQLEEVPWRSKWAHYKPVKPDDFYEKDWPYDANNDLEKATIARKVGSVAPLVVPQENGHGAEAATTPVKTSSEAKAPAQAPPEAKPTEVKPAEAKPAEATNAEAKPPPEATKAPTAKVPSESAAKAPEDAKKTAAKAPSLPAEAKVAPLVPAGKAEVQAPSEAAKAQAKEPAKAPAEVTKAPAEATKAPAEVTKAPTEVTKAPAKEPTETAKEPAKAPSQAAKQPVM